MPLASAGIVGDIQTGDIDFLSGGIGNHGVSGSELSKIFGAQAQVAVLQEANERKERRQRLQLVVISASVVSAILLIIFLFYLFNKKPSPST
ncbi:MAG: hypothetical protein ACRBFS_21620 [Aureispira sp.]